MPHARRLDESMNRQQRERHPLRELQLEMAVVLEPVGIEAVDDSRNESRPRRSGQAADQHIGRDPGKEEPRQHQQVVRDDRMDAEGEERRREQRGQEHRIRVGQRQPLGVEDVRVEQRTGIPEELTVHPADPPHRKERIAEIGHRVHGHQLREQRGHAEQTESGDSERQVTPFRGPGQRRARVSLRLEIPVPSLMPAFLRDTEEARVSIDRVSDDQQAQRDEERTVRTARGHAQAADRREETARQLDHQCGDTGQQDQGVED